MTIRIVDSTDGTPETGVVADSSGPELWYRREGGLKVAVTAVALSALDDAHADGGLLHISDGYYRLDLPDAAFATGANHVDVGGSDTGMVFIGGRVRLTDVDLEDSVRAGLGSLPNASADAAGGLPISDAGGLDLDTLLARLDATITSRLAASSAPANFSALSITAAGLVDITQAAADKVWGTASRTLTSFGTLVADVAMAVWGAVTRTLTAGTNIALAKGVGVTGLNDLSEAQVNAQADLALSDYDGPTHTELLNLVRLMVRSDAALTTDLSALITSINADLGSGSGSFAHTTEALQAIRDRGDAAWTTGAGGSAPTVVEIRQEIDANSTALALIVAQLVTVDGVVDAIKLVTDNLPDSGALTTLLSNVAAILVDTGTTLDDKVDAIKAVTDLLPDSGALTTLLVNVASALADTNELQGDWTNGGRLDLLVDAIKAKTDNLPAAPAGTGDAMTLTSGERDAVATALLDLASAVDGNTLRQIFRLLAAAQGGKTSGMGSSSAAIRDLQDSKDRVTATVDEDGNRSVVTLDLT